MLRELCLRYERTRPAFRPADLEPLRDYAFPGNVRELRNLIERSLLRTDPQAPFLALDLGWLRSKSPPQAALAQASDRSSGSSSGGPRVFTTLEEQEYQLIAQALRDERGAIRRAAARLGLTHQALLRRLQKWPELRESGSPSPPH